MEIHVLGVFPFIIKYFLLQLHHFQFQVKECLKLNYYSRTIWYYILNSYNFFTSSLSLSIYLYLSHSLIQNIDYLFSNNPLLK